MKTFAQYLTESAKTFDYRIKICGEVAPGFLKSFKEKLEKFDPVKISDPKTTPIQAKPVDFPAATNQRVTIIDGTFRYPATPPQIQQFAELLGLAADNICINDLQWSEGMDTELAGIQDQTEPLLTSEYPTDSKEQKQLSQEYANGNQQIVKNSAEKATWTVAGGKTPPAVTTNDLPQGVVSPMSTVKRPARPATGRNPQGKQ
jgi:hypothetical protein